MPPTSSSDASVLYKPLTLARANPAGFAFYCSRGQWQPAPHLLLTSEALVDLTVGRIDRLALFMPPRHGKSELASKHFPAWLLGSMPWTQVILASYEAEFAASWGARAKTLIQSHGKDVFGVILDPDAQARNDWGVRTLEVPSPEVMKLVNRKGWGRMRTAGALGPITGKGCDIGIIEDPVKSDKEANSQVMRDNLWEWYRATFYTRLEPDGKLVLIQTRWHEDDLAGRIQKLAAETEEKWHIINFPAIAEEDDALGRQPGDPLWPERYGLERLREIETAVGPYWWSALYQQRPTPEGGDLFRRSDFRYFHVEGDFYVLGKEYGSEYVPIDQCFVIQTCDPAASEKASADWFVMGTWVVTPRNDLLLVDILRTRLEGPRQPELFVNAYARFHPQVQGIETKAMGLTLFQAVRDKGLPVWELKADHDKVTRALPMAARYSAGKVFHPAGNEKWLPDYETELLSFPKGMHDDQVDVAAYAAILLAEVRQAVAGEAVLELDDRVSISPI